MVTSPNGQGVIIIGGKKSGKVNTSDLLKLNCDIKNEGCKWVKMSQRLKVGRRFHEAFYIPNAMSDCD